MAHAKLITIDDFTSGPFVTPMTLNNDLLYDVRTTRGSMFGGERTVRGSYNSNPLNQNLVANVGDQGWALFSGGPGASGAFEFDYTGFGTNGITFDFTDNDRFRFDFLASSRTVGMSVYVSDSFGVTRSAALDVLPDTNGLVDIKFSAFGTGPGTVDWGHVNRIRMDFTTQAGGNFALNAIFASTSTPSPEPATIAVVALGLAGVIRSRRKSR